MERRQKLRLARTNQYQLNTNNLSAGIYYVRIQSTNEIKTKAVSITK